MKPLKFVLWLLSLLVLIAAIGIGLALVFIFDAIHNGAGIYSILAFVACAFIFGLYLNYVIDKIKELLE